jgi:hypothetical protein
VVSFVGAIGASWSMKLVDVVVLMKSSVFSLIRSFFDCSNKRNSNNQLDVNRTLSCLYHQMIGGDMKNDATDSKDNVFLHRNDDIGYMSDVLTYDSEALNDIKKMKN